VSQLLCQLRNRGILYLSINERTDMTTLTDSPRTRGIFACKLDDRKLADLIADARIEAGEKIVEPKDIYPEPSVLALNAQGSEFALINSEGVGSWSSDGYLLAHYTLGQYGGIIESVKVPFTQLEDLDTEHDQVDLADFIRTFGARLDNNHQIWVNWYNY
jgi:hypothetical protein